MRGAAIPTERALPETGVGAAFPSLASHCSRLPQHKEPRHPAQTCRVYFCWQEKSINTAAPEAQNSTSCTATSHPKPRRPPPARGAPHRVVLSRCRVAVGAIGCPPYRPAWHGTRLPWMMGTGTRPACTLLVFIPRGQLFLSGAWSDVTAPGAHPVPTPTYPSSIAPVSLNISWWPVREPLSWDRYLGTFLEVFPSLWLLSGISGEIRES